MWVNITKDKSTLLIQKQQIGNYIKKGWLLKEDVVEDMVEEFTIDEDLNKETIIQGE